jgi:hypothetical protein
MKSFLILMVLFSFAGCGDLFMQSKKAKENSTGQQFLTCELDTTAFSRIFKENIKGDIDCLHSSLNNFMSLIRVDHKKGYLHRDKLKTFIQKFSEDENYDENILNIIDAIFDISYLIFGGDRGYIHPDDVDALVDFMKTFNDEMRVIYDLFTRERHYNYNAHKEFREIVRKSSLLLSRKMKEIYVEDRDRGNYEISVNKLFKDLLGHGEQDIYRKFKKLIFVKKIFFGGEAKKLNYVEFSDFLRKIPNLSILAYDLARSNKISYIEEQGEILNLYLKDVTIVRNELLFHDPESNEVIFSLFDLVDVVMEFFPDLGLDLYKYVDFEIQELKEVILGAGGPFITSQEIKVALDHAYNILHRGHFYYRMYNYPKYKEILSQPCQITPKENFGSCAISFDFSDFPINNNIEAEYRKDFARIVHNYRFTKGSFKAPFYSTQYKRNPNAMFEVSVLEYAAGILLRHYGHADPNARGGYALTLKGMDSSDNPIDEGLQRVMMRFDRILKDLEITLPGRKLGKEWLNAADNVMLMSTLFQAQSNGGGPKGYYLEAPEVVEFAISIFTALEVRDFFIDEMTKACSKPEDKFCNNSDTPKTCDRVKVSCFRKVFMDVMNVPTDNGLALKDYTPRLYEYLISLKNKGETDLFRFYKEAESFTRTCNFFDPAKTEEAPMTKNDMLAVFAGLLNVESTLLRFDINENNIMDPTEVMTSYDQVYEEAITGMIKDMGIPMLDKLSKPIFKYLIKYKKVPTSNASDILHFMRFLVRFNKKAPADRETIASILRIIGETSENAKTNPFRCCRFRNLDVDDLATNCKPGEFE